ncbi:Serine carboxypeptidase-like 51 [Camellia lanceoleosa]|uniref:Serine carboxypeptidase-like 51 n=1 Tax=Camellia lanceoleosa TaxID=1840588 RepID=A0ACC0F8R5_9ERIC|nr:Serine carboxypeptidase-like 51 [Camellia lanceoleosa]
MASMKSLVLLVSLSLLVSNSLVLANFHLTAGTDDGSEQWGYVEVRPKAHMFWWLYRSPHRVEDPSNPWPTILWLQGGLEGSRVGFGNFLEIRPLDLDLKPWNSTWLTKADLLLVDSPVGTGFNYVEDESLAVKTDEVAATDLTAMLKALFNGNETLQKSPLFIIVESYGGKFAFSWGPLLKDLSRLDGNALYSSNSLAQKIQQELAEEKYEDATNTWGVLEDVISVSSNDVDFYNFMLDSSNDPLESRTYESKGLMVDRYSKYMCTKIFSSINSASGLDLYTVMNGPIKQKLKIIPENVTWDGQGAIVFPAMVGDFMKPRIKKVDKLLAKGVNVTIYNGQIDLISATKGTEAWIDKLEWEGLKSYLNLSRTPLFCGEDNITTKAFVRSYKNLFFYWILGAGHFVKFRAIEVQCLFLGFAVLATMSVSWLLMETHCLGAVYAMSSSAADWCIVLCCCVTLAAVLKICGCL